MNRLQAGLGLCTGLPIQGLSDWGQLFQSATAALLCVPGLAAGLLLCLVSRYASHEAVLPAVMTALPLAFYLVLWLLGALSSAFFSPPDVDDGLGGGGGAEAEAGAGEAADARGMFTVAGARAFGWLGQDTAGASVGDMAALFDAELVDWSVVPQQLPVFASMVFVVAFSSCLDVAAIEMDVGRPLDVNSELTVVGWSNVVAGLLGGFTGSYIFSQTIFTCRSYVRPMDIDDTKKKKTLERPKQLLRLSSHVHMLVHGERLFLSKCTCMYPNQ